jgi:hypothetical protein
MIHSEYQNDEKARTFTIRFSNTPLGDPGFKAVTATYHLENAINKAFDNVRPDKFSIEVDDARNHYLKLIAGAFVAYLRGLGYAATAIDTKNC